MGKMIRLRDGPLEGRSVEVEALDDWRLFVHYDERKIFVYHHGEDGDYYHSPAWSDSMTAAFDAVVSELQGQISPVEYHGEANTEAAC